MLKRTLQQAKRFTTETHKYNVYDFKEKYPISIDTIRKNAFQEHMGKLQPFDHYFLMPIRNWLADITTSNWINQRFKNEASDPPYLQSEFLSGAKLAIIKFFELLQKDIDMVDSDSSDSTLTNDSMSLRNVVTKRLYQDFKSHHESFKRNNLELSIRLNSLSNLKRVQNWMEFGPPERVTTTLEKGMIHSEFAPYVFWRFNPEKRKWLFREVTFEYDVSRTEVDLSQDELEPPSLQTRSELTRMGAVVGIEVLADVDITITIKENEDVWVETLRREMGFRFETTHFSGKYQGSWKIADVDNCYASGLLDIE
jgi:hypothetical protein